MKDLTGRQREVLDFIRRHIRQCGRPPTLREIAPVLGVTSINGVNDHLLALERKGYIVRDVATARGIRIVQDMENDYPAIDDVLEEIRYLRRAYFRCGSRMTATNEPLFLADVRKVLEENRR